MSFFDPLPEPARERRRPPQPPWAGPPANELGAGVGISVLLARTERHLVGIEAATAFSVGVELRLVVRRRPPGDGDGDGVEELSPFGWGHRHAPRDQLRFGVEFSDGAKAVLDGAAGCGPEKPRAALCQRGGHGSGDEQRLDVWLWPLPPPGPLAFVVAWPAAGIAETRTEIEAADIRDAAARAVQIWPEGEPALSPGYHTSRQIMFGAEPNEQDEPS